MAWRGKPGAWVGVYCPNGERLALVGEDGHVRVLDAVLRSFGVHTAVVQVDKA